MTQDERCLVKYNEMLDFMKRYHSRLSKHIMEQRYNWIWMRHQQKLLVKGEMKEERGKNLDKKCDLNR